MPIRIPDALPATAALEEENIFVMTEYRAMHQDIRPLQRAASEPHAHEDRHRDADSAQAARTPRCRSRSSLLQTATSRCRRTRPHEHLDAFYTTFDDVKDEHFDGLIITGAPVELLDFEDGGLLA